VTTVLGAKSWTEFHGAPSEPAVATQPTHCVCPCYVAGHRSDKTCRVKIAVGDSYRLVLLHHAARPQSVPICHPCWSAIDREAKRAASEATSS
jgi:hypothetical protein